MKKSLLFFLILNSLFKSYTMEEQDSNKDMLNQTNVTNVDNLIFSLERQYSNWLSTKGSYILESKIGEKYADQCLQLFRDKLDNACMTNLCWSHLEIFSENKEEIELLFKINTKIKETPSFAWCYLKAVRDVKNDTDYKNLEVLASLQSDEEAKALCLRRIDNDKAFCLLSCKAYEEYEQEKTNVARSVEPVLSVENDFIIWGAIEENTDFIIKANIGEKYADECLNFLQGRLDDLVIADVFGGDIKKIFNCDENFKILTKINNMIQITPSFTWRYLTEVRLAEKNNAVGRKALKKLAYQSDEETKALLLRIRDRDKAIYLLSKKAYEEYQQWI